MKTCKNCKKQFPIYIKIGTKYHNLCNRKFCLECSPFKSHNTRDITKEKASTLYPNKGTYRHVKLFRERKKQKAVEYLGGKCRVCGYNKHYKMLEFHHLDPSQKDFGISSKASWGFEKIKTEIEKCALLCPNCHREVHLGLVVLEGFAPPT